MTVGIRVSLSTLRRRSLVLILVSNAAQCSLASVQRNATHGHFLLFLTQLTHATQEEYATSANGRRWCKRRNGQNESIEATCLFLRLLLTLCCDGWKLGLTAECQHQCMLYWPTPRQWMKFYPFHQIYSASTLYHRCFLTNPRLKLVQWICFVRRQKLTNLPQVLGYVCPLSNFFWHRQHPRGKTSGGHLYTSHRTLTIQAVLTSYLLYTVSHNKVTQHENHDICVV